MSIRITAILFGILAIGVGCRGRNSSSPDLNSPRSPAEAHALMAALDRQSVELGWPEEVLRHMRHAMRGRLLAAGLPEAEIEQWIKSDLRNNKITSLSPREMSR
jgi:hypothetical protein